MFKRLRIRLTVLYLIFSILILGLVGAGAYFLLRISLAGAPGQAQILRQFSLGLLVLICCAAILLALGAWWLAGLSIDPAQRAWEQQRTFIANASHELRTPLTLIRASVEIAQRQTVTLQHRYLLADVLNDCDYMKKLMEDLLLLSGLDNQRLAIEPRVVDLSQFIPEISAQMQKVAGQKSVVFDVLPSTGTVWVDPIRLKQVLLILLDNAFRYTPSGGRVQLSAAENTGSVAITVADSGVGIPPEHLPHVFERFYKVERVSTDEYRGSGLGLSIAKSLVEIQGGAIHIDSRVDQGTRVRLEFPNRK